MKVKHGHLYLADLNPQRGTESGKVRPVVVIQTDLLNDIQHPSTWILPCTTKLTQENILRVRLNAGLAGNTEDCDVMIDQNRSIDNRRLVKKLGCIPHLVLDEIVEKLTALGELR